VIVFKPVLFFTQKGFFYAKQSPVFVHYGMEVIL